MHRHRRRLLLSSSFTLLARCSASSQGPQDAIIRGLLARIGHGRRQYVEFGFDSNEHCSGGGGSNTCALAREHGWTGVLLDGAHENAKINLHKAFVRSDTIAQTLKSHNVSRHVDFMSIDLDSVDLWVLRALLGAQDGFRPRLLMVEYNSHFPWSAAITFPDPVVDSRTTLTGFSRTCAYGASARALSMVAASFGYVAVGIALGWDLFFVPAALAKAHAVPLIDLSLERTELHFHHAMSAAQAAQLLEFGVLNEHEPRVRGANYSAAGEQAPRPNNATLAALSRAAAIGTLTALARDLPRARNLTCRASPTAALCSSKRGLFRTRDEVCYQHLTKGTQ